MIDALYGDDYNHGLCEDVVGENYPKISEDCQAFFDAENCFYECDKNAVSYTHLTLPTKA